MIKAWTSHSLSYAGRLELIKSVVQGVSCYWLSIFPIPAIVSWRQVCLPKEEGGLGLRDLCAWNRALAGYEFVEYMHEEGYIMGQMG